MTDELDLVGMFEGMEPSQAKELTARIRSAIKREYQNYQKGETMDTLEFENLSDDEKKTVLADHEASMQKIAQARQAKQLDGLREQYEAELKKIGGNITTQRRAQLIGQLKSKYRRAGLSDLW